MPDYDHLMDRLENVIDYIVKADQPEMTDGERVVLTGHLTGAVIVTVMDHDREEANAAEAPGPEAGRHS